MDAKLFITLVCVAVSAFLSSTSSSQTLLVGWNFNNNTSGNPATSLGVFNATGDIERYDALERQLAVGSNGTRAGEATIDFSNLAGDMGGSANDNWGTLSGSTANAVSGDAAGAALVIVGAGNNGKAISFTLSTTGFDSIGLSFAGRNTSTGATTLAWEWSDNQIDWHEWQTVTGLSTTFSSFALNPIGSLGKLESAYIRMTVSGATGSTGNLRLDNVQIFAVPEPQTCALLVFGAILIIWRRKEFSKAQSSQCKTS